MNDIFYINETLTNGYSSESLSGLYLFVVLCGIYVIISKNPIVSVLFLIGLFSGIASYLIILGLNFIGLSYLIVYVGAVSILFLFILMLINIRISELQSNTSNSIALGIIIGILFNHPLSQLMPYGIAIFNSFAEILDNSWDIITSYVLSTYITNANSIINNNVLFVTGNTWEGFMAEIGHIGAIGNIMYTNYNIWLIIASFILLLAMTGAIIITIKQKN